jgi:hypothetical protein
LWKVRAFAANFGTGCGRLSTSFPKVTSPKSLPALCDFSDYGTGSWETHARGHSPVSQQSLQWVFDHCYSCLQEHSRCNGFTETSVLSSANHLENPPTFPSAVLPTRVLKLGKEGDTVQLVEPTQGTFESYACLSHCWGNSQRIITTNDTIGQRKAGIAWDMLPKTFQDAITFTRMLRIGYLWIDCLCIVQDSTRDWHREAAQMAAIYRNSVITLAATSSRDSTRGLFANFYYDLDGWYKTSQMKVYVFAEWHWGDAEQFAKDDIRYLTHCYPLLQRAWAYQERLLSRRILHFCDTELVWECMEGSICQCRGVPDHGSPKKTYSEYLDHVCQTSGTKQQKPPAGDQNRDDDSGEQRVISLLSKSPEQQQRVIDSWQVIVQEYCRLNLTYEVDRLPALAGIAEQFHALHTGRYLAGLWEDTFLDDLNWMVPIQAGDEDTRSRRPKSTTPSWSWASLGSANILWKYEFKENPVCKIVEVSCTPIDSSNPRGGVLNGRLKIMGPLAPAVMDYSNSNQRLYWGHNRNRLIFQPSDFTLRIDHDRRDYQSNGEEKVFCLVTGATRPPLSYVRHFAGLLLTCIDEEAQTYERIGFFNCTGTWNDEDSMPVFPGWDSTLTKGFNLTPNTADGPKEPYLLRSPKLSDFSLSIGLEDNDWITVPDAQSNSINSSSAFKKPVDYKCAIARLTPEQAAKAQGEASSDNWPYGYGPRLGEKLPGFGSSAPERGEWFLTVENAVLKERGEKFYWYFGKTITIV